MLHTMLTYSDVIADLVYVNICTLPLENRPGVDKFKYPKKTEEEEQMAILTMLFLQDASLI